MAEPITSDDAGFWENHCWHNRWDGQPCGKPAKWMGPQKSHVRLARLWRACDAHRLPGDLPYEELPK